MPLRQQTNYGSVDWSGLGASPEPQKKKKNDPLADFLSLAGAVAPVAGTVIGGVAGGPGGALLGNAIGQGAGAAANWGAERLGADEREEEAMRVERERERQARQQAALSLFGQAG